MRSELPACMVRTLPLLSTFGVLKVDWETATGAVNMVLIHQLIANAYRNVSNVVVAITPKALPRDAKAVLLNAHYDNTLSSPGLFLVLDA